MLLPSIREGKWRVHNFMFATDEVPLAEDPCHWPTRGLFHREMQSSVLPIHLHVPPPWPPLNIVTLSIPPLNPAAYSIPPPRLQWGWRRGLELHSARGLGPYSQVGFSPNSPNGVAPHSNHHSASRTSTMLTTNSIKS